MPAGLTIPDPLRQSIGEALLVYIYRALGKPRKPSYFHVKLLDVLIKSARDSYKLSLGIQWAHGTNSIRPFDHRSTLDDHPDAPEWAAKEAISRGQAFAFLSNDAISRIVSMTIEKRRQLEAIAADIFPDHEAIAGAGPLFSDAHETKDAYHVDENRRYVDRVKKSTDRVTVEIDELEKAIKEILSDENLERDERSRIEKELEDLLIGRLELERPQISAELLYRVMLRGLNKISEWTASAIVGKMAERAIAALLLAFPTLN